MYKALLKPQEILLAGLNAAESKAKGGFVKLAVLGVLAGAFVALAGFGSTMASFGLLSEPGSYGVGRTVLGAVFAVALMMILIGGGELFTGNTLLLNAVVKRRISLVSMLRNWLIVYAGNFAGAILIAALVAYTGLFQAGGDLLGAITIKVAAGKTALAFGPAFALGILCNWLVCMAVWLSWATDTMSGKLFAIFFPIWLFALSGYEHCVANMYYIPAGIFAKMTAAFRDAAASHGVGADAMAGLDWGNFFAGNLLPVTLGNIVGGALCVGLLYLLAYHKDVQGKV